MLSEESDFLMSYEIMPLRTSDSADILSVSYFLPTIPVVLPWVILPIVGMSAMFYFSGPMFGSWGLSIGVVCIAIIVVIVFLVMMQKIIVTPLHGKRIRIVYNKRDKVLEIPPDDTAVPSTSIHSIVALHGWIRNQSSSALVSELSVVYREEGEICRSALFLTNKWKARKIGKALANLTNSIFQEIEKKKV